MHHREPALVPLASADPLQDTGGLLLGSALVVRGQEVALEARAEAESGLQCLVVDEGGRVVAGRQELDRQAGQLVGDVPALFVGGLDVRQHPSRQERLTTREERHVGGHGERRRGEGLGEGGPLRRQGVEVRGGVPVVPEGAQMVRPQAVDGDQQDAARPSFVGGFLGECRRREQNAQGERTDPAPEPRSSPVRIRLHGERKHPHWERPGQASGGIPSPRGPDPPGPSCSTARSGCLRARAGLRRSRASPSRP